MEGQADNTSWDCVSDIYSLLFPDNKYCKTNKSPEEQPTFDHAITAWHRTQREELWIPAIGSLTNERLGSADLCEPWAPAVVGQSQ